MPYSGLRDCWPADCFYGEPVWVNSFLVYADGASHKYGVMGKNGMVVVPPEYDEIRFLDNSPVRA